MGSRGAAQPRKVGQPKPSISSAAQLHSKKERKKERQGKQEQRKPRRGRKRNQRPMSPFCLSTKMKVNIHLQHRNWPQNFSMTKRTVIKISPRQPNRHGCQCPKCSHIVFQWWSDSQRLCIGLHLFGQKSLVISPLIQTMGGNQPGLG